MKKGHPARHDVLGRPLVTGWEGGPRRVACLACDRPFTSPGKSTRICPACSKLDRRGGLAEARGALRLSGGAP